MTDDQDSPFPVVGGGGARPRDRAQLFRSAGPLSACAADHRRPQYERRLVLLGGLWIPPELQPDVHGGRMDDRPAGHTARDGVVGRDLELGQSASRSGQQRARPRCIPFPSWSWRGRLFPRSGKGGSGMVPEERTRDGDGLCDRGRFGHRCGARATGHCMDINSHRLAGSVPGHGISRSMLAGHLAISVLPAREFQIPFRRGETPHRTGRERAGARRRSTRVLESH